MRLLIDTEDNLHMRYGLPWVYDGDCFNFKAPEKRVSSETEIENPEEVQTLVINCDLESYDFISKMKNLTQLYIYKGKNVKDLDFLKDLVRLDHFYLAGSKVPSLKSLVELIQLKDKLYLKEVEEGGDEMDIRLYYTLSCVRIISDAYEGDGSELLNRNICHYDLSVNDNRIEPKPRRRFVPGRKRRNLE